MRVFKDSDIDPGLIRDKRIAVIGYGNQGRPQALNLRDSGVSAVAVALREGSPSGERVARDGLEAMPLEKAGAWADILVMLTPDEDHPAIYDTYLKAQMKPGAALVFAHGLAVHFNLIEPRADIDVFLVSPKGPGTALRAEFERGAGLPSLLAVHQDATGNAHALGLAYAGAIGSGRAGVIETTVRDECVSDLFGEQTVLCGGLVGLVRSAWEVMVEAGYDPEVAYFECVHEVKLIADLIYERGIAQMNEAISNTAEYGEYVTGPRVVSQAVKAEMKEILAEIEAGDFARAWMAEADAGGTQFRAMRARNADHPIEAAGRNVRALLPWLTKGRGES
jgi:ketol-acid reductoisomerase